VLSTYGRAVEFEVSTALEYPVDDGVSQILVVKNPSPGIQGFVGSKDHRFFLLMAFVDDMEEDVGCIGAIGEVADLVDDEHCGACVGMESLTEAAMDAGGGEVVDEGGGSAEEGVEAVLNGAVGDGDGQVGLAAAWLAGEDEAAAIGDEVRGEVRADEGEADGGLEGEVEILDGFEEGEAGLAGKALKARLLAVGHFLGDESGKEVVVGPVFAFGPVAELAVDAGGVGEVEALEQQVERDGRGVHSGNSCWMVE
jgi:hypothetical protein